MSRFSPQSHREREKPRRVRGGIKVKTDGRPIGKSQMSRALVTRVEKLADDANVTEALDYGKHGQVASIEYEPGRIVAKVQGRRPRRYTVTISVPVLTEDQWNTVIDLLGETAGHGAAILNGELPSRVVDDLESHQLAPFSTTGEFEATLACDCEDKAELKDGVPCKHLIVMSYVAAEQIDASPLIPFRLRGMHEDDLAERLRLQRASASTSTGVQTLQMSDMATLDVNVTPLEETTDDFWSATSALKDLDISLTQPEIPHALLERLGPTPFTDSRFPLAGLLATCYDIISTAALHEQEE